MAEGRYTDAVTAYRTARSRNACPICYVAQLANALDKAGAVDSAAVYYERYLTTPQFGRAGADGLYRPASLRRLGELYDQAGDTEQALEYYGDFVELWAEADPVLQPQVEAVRNRMAELAGEGEYASAAGAARAARAVTLSIEPNERAHCALRPAPSPPLTKPQIS